MRIVTIAVVAVLALGACGGETDEATDPDTRGTPTPSESTSPTEAPMDANDPLGEALGEVASRAGVDRGDVQIVAHEQVTWRDGSLGCPEPDRMYTQALVEGYRVVLRVGGEEVAYHGRTGESPIRCDDPDPNGVVED